MTFSQVGAAMDGMIGNPFFWLLIVFSFAVVLIQESYFK